MSQENVELTRRAYEAFNRRDWAAFIALMDDGVEVGTRQVAIEGSYPRGHEGVRRWWNDLFDAFPDYTAAAEELRDLGDVTLAHIRGSAHSGENELPVADTFWQATRWHDRRGVCWRNWSPESEALDAVGLRGKATSEGDPATTFRRAMEAYSRGDYDAAVLDFDPAIEWSVDLSVTPDATTYHGHEGVKRFWDTWAEAISGMELEIEECRGIGQDRVLAIVRARGIGAGSGAPVASPRFSEIADFRDGRVVKVRVYGGVAAALEAAGLRE